MDIISTLLYLVAAIYGVYAYEQHKYSQFIVVLYLIASYFSGFVTVGIKPVDFFLMTVVPLGLANINLFRCADDKLGKWILYLLTYVFIVSFANILLGVENIKYSLMLFRFHLIFIVYFLFKKIPYSDLLKAFHYLFYITVFSGFFYYLQYVGIVGILRGTDEGMNLNQEYLWFYNVPILTPAMLFYVCFSKKTIKYRFLYIIFFAGMIIGCMSRGYIIANLLALGVYMIKNIRNRRNIILISSFGLIALFLLPVLSYRFSKSGSVGNGLYAEFLMSKKILSGTLDFNQFGSGAAIDNGTGVYRTLLIAEKINYLAKSPITFLFGGGAVHGSSPNIKRYNFRFGQSTIINGRKEKQQIDTSDVAFLSNVFRYGFVYLFLFCGILYYSWKGMINKKTALFIAGWGYMATCLFQFYGSNRLEYVEYLFFILLVASQIKHNNLYETIRRIYRINYT